MTFLTQIIKNQGPLSKGELAKLSGLSVVTMNKLIPELVASEVVQEFSDSVVTGGRHAVSYEYNAQYQLLLVIQLIEKNQQIVFNFYISDLYGTILRQEESSDLAFSWVELKEKIQKFLIEEPKIKGISIGIPGVEVEGILKMSDHPQLIGVHLRKEIALEFQLPVTIENDINAAVLGYAAKQDGKNESIVGIYYPRDFPPGSGIWLNGQIVRGRNGFAGEIKYLPLTAKWHEVPVSEIDLAKNMSEVIQTIISMYDPNEIVIYTESKRLLKEDRVFIEASLFAKFSTIKLPKLVSSASFDQDYLHGLLVQGIELIEKMQE